MLTWSGEGLALIENGEECQMGGGVWLNVEWGRTGSFWKMGTSARWGDWSNSC